MEHSQSKFQYDYLTSMLSEECLFCCMVVACSLMEHATKSELSENKISLGRIPEGHLPLLVWGSLPSS